MRRIPTELFDVVEAVRRHQLTSSELPSYLAGLGDTPPGLIDAVRRLVPLGLSPEALSETLLQWARETGGPGGQCWKCNGSGVVFNGHELNECDLCSPAVPAA